MGLQRFPYSDFTGGVNLRDGPFNLNPYEAQDALNKQVTQRGTLRDRNGKVRLDSAGFPAAKIADNAEPWYLANGTRLLMLSIDGDIYSMTTTGVLTRRFDGTPGTVWDFAQGQNASGVDFIWCLNGTDPPQKWNGSTGSTVAWLVAGSAQQGTMCTVWHNKMCTAGDPAHPERLSVSAIGDPENPDGSFPWIDIKSTADDLAKITWLLTVEDSLMVFKADSVWRVPDPVALTNQRLGPPGCFDRFQAAEYYGTVYYLTRAGIWTVSTGSEPSEESDLIRPFFPEKVNFSALSKARMIRSPNDRILIALPTENNYNDILLEGMPDLKRIFHIGGRRLLGPTPFMFHSFQCASLAVFRPLSQDLVVAGDAQQAKVHELFTGTDDDGTPITGYWFGSWTPIQGQEPLERLRRVNIEHSGSTIVDVFRDLNANTPFFSKRVSQDIDQALEWDDGGIWDDGLPWDPKLGVGMSRVRPESRARYHAIRLRREAEDTPSDVFAIEIVARGGKEITESVGTA